MESDPNASPPFARRSTTSSHRAATSAQLSLAETSILAQTTTRRWTSSSIHFFRFYPNPKAYDVINFGGTQVMMQYKTRKTSETAATSTTKSECAMNGARRGAGGLRGPAPSALSGPLHPPARSSFKFSPCRKTKLIWELNAAPKPACSGVVRQALSHFSHSHSHLLPEVLSLPLPLPLPLFHPPHLPFPCRFC